MLNVSKTKCVIFDLTHALRSELLLSLPVKGTALEQVHEAKLLGVALDEQLTWSCHIDRIFAKMGRAVSVIRGVPIF